MILPRNDDALELMIAARGTLERQGYVLAEANDDVLGAMLDKERTYAAARAAGVAVPTTVTLHEDADIDLAVEQVSFPCAVKPLQSHRFAHHFGLSKKVFLVSDAAELRDSVTRLREFGVSAMATEIVPGPDDGFASFYSYLDENGEPLFRLTKRKLRQYPITSGSARSISPIGIPRSPRSGCAFSRAPGSGASPVSSSSAIRATAAWC